MHDLHKYCYIYYYTVAPLYLNTRMYYKIINSFFQVKCKLIKILIFVVVNKQKLFS